MAMPDYQTLMLPMLVLAADGVEHTLGEALDHLAAVFHLSVEERSETIRSGQTRLYNRTAWASSDLRRAGVLESVGPGRFRITDAGRQVLAEKPARIDVAFLRDRFPDVMGSRGANGIEPASYAEGEWEIRPDVEKRIADKMAQSIPDEPVRRAAIELLAFAIENADEERADAWFVKETELGLALMAGRLLACKITRSKARVSVIGPVSDEARLAIGAEAEDDAEFKYIPGGILLTFPVEHAGQALELLREGLNSFIDLSMARVRRTVSLEEHVPEVVSYASSVVGRTLPQPTPALPEVNGESQDPEEDDDTASREPVVRGRGPIFAHGERQIASLLSDIDPARAVIALPDLQRPFVWEDTKVRDLLDSLFLGFPVGTLVLWHTTAEQEARAIGADRPALKVTALVIDGQQRLTSLYAVMRGAEVVGKEGEKRRITIAFRPRDGRFEVADAAIRNDPEFLPDVSELWSGRRSKFQIRQDLLKAVAAKGREVDDRLREAVELNLERAHGLSEYKFPTIEIRCTAGSNGEPITDEDVAEIFVRINNQGTKLGQADFVLTLLSVFHGKLRDRLEARARDLSQGPLVTLDTQQLLRAACAVAFGRARMKAIYNSLRGVDPVTGLADPETRARRLDELDRAVTECVELTPWRDYTLRLKHAGFVSETLIGSKNAVVNAFAFYVLGRRIGVSKQALDEVVSRWVFATLLTARYSGSSETTFEQDLARVGQDSDPDGFVRALDVLMGEAVGGDYWTRALVASLVTQKARTPSALAFRAAQVVLGARALFSDQLLQNLLEPPAQGARSAREAHHLFPEAWLHARGVRDRRLINQVANLADTGWYEDSMIGAKGPKDYVPKLRQKLGIGDDSWGRMCAEHALPIGWETMDYEPFLEERRRRMAEIVRIAFRKLGGESDAEPLSPPWFPAGSEAVWQQIVQAERTMRALVRDVYAGQFGQGAAARIEASLPETQRQTLQRALRARPAGADPLSIVDYLYLAQLPALLFANDVWGSVKQRLGGTADLKQRLQAAVQDIAPVRNEIAHVREVGADRLMRATLACSDIARMVTGA